VEVQGGEDSRGGWGRKGKGGREGGGGNVCGSPWIDKESREDRGGRIGTGQIIDKWASSVNVLRQFSAIHCGNVDRERR
jgi:hypothetical protein